MNPLSSESSPAVSNSVDALLSLRGIACLVVVLFHCSISRELIIYPPYDFSWLLLGDGIVAVWIFFALSGYLMGKAFYTYRYLPTVSGYKAFFMNRFLRICPLYYFSVLIIAIFVYPEILKAEKWFELFRILTFTYTFPLPLSPNHPDFNFNPVIWSLSTEVQFYLIVPFLYTAFRPILVSRTKILITALAIIGFTSISRGFALLFFPHHTSLILSLDVFLSGFLLNAWFQCKPRKNMQPAIFLPIKKRFKNLISLKAIAIFVMIGLYLISAYHGYHHELWNTTTRPATLMQRSLFITPFSYYVMPVLTGICTTFFIYAFECNGQYNNIIKNKKLSFETCLENPARILEIMGVLSYGIYLWHYHIIQNIAPIVTVTDPLTTFFHKLSVVVILSVILSAVTYSLVEVPYAKRKKYSSSVERGNG